MPAKTEAKESPSADKEKAAPAAAAPAASSKSAKGGGGLLPALVVALMAPVASWAVAQFVVLPALEKKLLAGTPATLVVSGEGTKGGKGEPSAPPAYDFKDVVVNLAGTMGTRYLKTSFIVTGSDSSMHAAFEENKVKLTDVTLNVLSSLTLADLEEPGSKNVLREKLVGAYNQALGKKLAEQVYFSDFVVQ
ncbi:MAG TPA: flagellar basal body-associated FliL family protein [Opitutaceae bacterium]|jgi:flagellar FliL protein